MWFLGCLAIYALLVRPQLFAEREERRKQLQREEAEYAKYEDEWHRCVRLAAK